MIYINGKGPDKHPIMKCDVNTLKCIKIYDSVKEAAADLPGNTETNYKSIYEVVNKPNRTCKGFAWRWKPIQKKTGNLAKGAVKN